MTMHQQIPLWKKAPFIRLLPPLCCGILIGHYIQPDINTSLTVAAVTIFLLVFLEFLKPEARFIFRSFSGIFLMIWIALFGIILHHYNDVRNDPDWFGGGLQDAEAISVTLTTQPKPAGKGFKVLSDVNTVVTGHTTKPAVGKLLLYFENQDAVRKFAPGDRLILKNKVRHIRNSGNPGSFDFERFMAVQNVYHDALIKTGEWKKAGKAPKGFFTTAVNASLRYSQKAIRKNITGPEETALATALLTGDRSQLDRDLVQAYANTGVVHLMAISGLHLGLIYIFLVQLCNVLPGIRNHQWARLILVLGGIWFFACMTGLSPSVTRAAVMFSFLALGILKRRKITTYNFWSAAAFLMLCINPLLLFNVGFQLSYLAVLGILVVQKPVYHWLYFENKLVDYVWQMISVTLAAQLFTLPLCLYYFHQFPVLFILANLVAIPLASIGLWLGVVLLLTASLPAIPAMVGSVANGFFRLLNEYIHYVNSLSFSVWKGFSPTISETILLSLCIVLLVHALMRKSRVSMRAALIAGVLMLTSKTFWYVQRIQQRKVIVYNIPYQTAVDFVNGERYTHLAFSTPPINQPDKNILVARNVLGVSKPDTVMICKPFGRNELFINRKSFLHIKAAEEFPLPPVKIRVDAVIISGSPKISISNIHQAFDARIYIFTPSNRRYLVEKWKKECEDLLLRSHDIAADGAMVMNF